MTAGVRRAAAALLLIVAISAACSLTPPRGEAERVPDSD